MNPMSALLSDLAAAGVVERASSRSGPSHLRVAARFLSHAERETARRQSLGLAASAEDVLAAVLTVWDEYSGDARSGAEVVFAVMAERHQLGLLRPAFPTLDAFALAA